MTLNEKFEYLYTVVIENATNQSVELVEDHKKTLQRIFDERKQTAVKKAESIYQAEKENIIREKNKKLSSEAMEIRRSVLEEKGKLIDKIYDGVMEKLKDFMKSDGYKEYLTRKIKEAYSFARKDSITIYINPSDQSLIASLEKDTGMKLTLSKQDFIGGIRAVIPSRSILIDESFQTKLTEARDTFKL